MHENPLHTLPKEREELMLQSQRVLGFLIIWGFTDYFSLLYSCTSERHPLCSDLQMKVI